MLGMAMERPCRGFMKTLIVGAGALGGIIGARLLAAGGDVSLATRNAKAAEEIKASGLRVTGVGGDLSTEAGDVTRLADYSVPGTFDLIILATKAQDAVEVAPSLVRLLAPKGTLLPIQNGGVSQMLASQVGDRWVLGGISNLTGTMLRTGLYEQTNDGYLLIGELAGGESDRSHRVSQWLNRAVNVRVTPNFQGAFWSKLLLNCSVTTIGAIAGLTMRAYIDRPEGRELFRRTYDEALSVALASGVRPEKMLVDPIPPGRDGRNSSGEAYSLWLREILTGYGDAKASMLQDFERRRTTEIAFINGYVVNTGRQFGVGTPVNAALVETVHAITSGQSSPDPNHLQQILENSVDKGDASVTFPLNSNGERR
jgi:2-dehydropantoate 2-reductase